MTDADTTVARVAGDAVVDVSPTATLRDAAELLVEQLVGALLVVRPNGAMGILSERDLVRAVADDADLDTERIGDWCTDDVLRCPGDTPVADAVELMQESQVRHIVVDLSTTEARVVSLRALVPGGVEARG